MLGTSCVVYIVVIRDRFDQLVISKNIKMRVPSGYDSL